MMKTVNIKIPKKEKFLHLNKNYKKMLIRKKKLD
jgi:hypothetical protein